MAMTLETDIISLCVQAKDASRTLAHASAGKKNMFLENLAELLRSRKAEILEINAQDVEMARKDGMDAARLDRLALTDKLMDSLAESCLFVKSLPDPVGAMESQWQRPNGLLVGKMRVPLGVVAMIYEARPGVTIDAAILCIKAGNAVILRGGREAWQTNIALAALLREAAENSGLPGASAQLVARKERDAVNILCRMNNYIDVIIPRGGEGLVNVVCKYATMPVLKHYKGVCHAYIDADAELEQACEIVVNSKTQRPGVCNALEGLLVNRQIASVFLPMLAKSLKSRNVVFHADGEALPLLGEGAVPMIPDDRGREFHSLDLTVIVVADIDEAFEYIAQYGSNHTEIICTSNYFNAMRFLREVDASMVGVNVSTRFNDGGELGLGAEIGISTSKLHAYGPMGVRELTTTKFVVLGNGQVRQ